MVIILENNNHCGTYNGAKPEVSSPIGEFFRDRGVFVTGGTGFLGKILIEKILRSCPEVKNVYILLRSKDGMNPSERMQELLNSPVYDRIKKENPMALTKLVPVVGDILIPGLGLSPSDLALLVDNASVVYHSAASVRFDEPLRKAIEINILGARRVLELCHKLKTVAAFVHVSTAYCFCNRDHVDEIVYPEKIHYQKVIDASEWLDEKLQEQILPHVMNGRPTTYHYTKALCENMLVEEGGNLPIVILRPSIVTSTYKEPLPGWVDNYNGPAGFVIASGKGVLRTMLIRPNSSADIYPVDMVANMMIASSWHAWKVGLSSHLVVNCTTGPMRRLTWEQIFNYSKPIVLKYPSYELFRYPGGSFKTSRFWHNIAMHLDHNVPAIVVDTFFFLIGQKPFLRDIYKRIHRALGILEFFVLHEWTFAVDNLKMLQAELKGKDRRDFDFDIRTVDWVPYLEEYVLGVRKYVLKEDPSTIPSARKKLAAIWYGTAISQLLMIVGVLRLLVKHNQTFNHLWWSLVSELLGLYVRVVVALRSR